MSTKKKADAASGDALAVQSPMQFEQALTELERIVASMESGGMSLDDSIQSYRRGVQLAKVCQEQLRAAQQQVMVLEQDLLRPFEDDMEADAQQ